MKTDEVEKVLKKNFQPGKGLKEQCTPAEWAEICFRSAVETDIISEQNKTGKTESNAQIEERVRAKWQKVLEDCSMDYEKALQEFG